jgi:hypothetical protein
MASTLVDVYMDAFVQFGDRPDLALAEVRNGAGRKAYDLEFPGIRREDGSLRMSEQEYFSTSQSYKATLAQRGLNPERFSAQFANLIESDVSANEFESRVQAVNEGINQQSENIRQAFASSSGIAEFSNEAVLASLLDPEGVGRELLERRIGMSQISGTARDFGFTISSDRSALLDARNLGLAGAQDFFAQAQSVTRDLSSVARRFDPNDQTVGIDEAADAMILGDQQQTDRFGRLVAREQATFSDTSSGVRRDRNTGAVIGLGPRR